MKPNVTTAVLSLALAFPGCNRPPEKKVIALITKAMDSEFWLVLADGAKSAAAEHPDYELVIASPDREINVDQQVSILENQIRRGVKVLLVDPAGTAQVNSTLEQAVSRGIPVILIDPRFSGAGIDRRHSPLHLWEGLGEGAASVAGPPLFGQTARSSITQCFKSLNATLCLNHQHTENHE